MNLRRITVKDYSDVCVEFSMASDDTILYVKLSGIYRIGSEGNLDGLYIFSMLCAHYFLIEPISVILDLTKLDYSWGNTLLKSLNFFFEIGRDPDEINKRIIIIQSQANKRPLEGLLNNVAGGNRLVCDNSDVAFEKAKQDVKEYLSI